MKIKKTGDNLKPFPFLLRISMYPMGHFTYKLKFFTLRKSVFSYFLLFILSVLTSAKGFATIYYLVAGGTVTNIASWGTAINGTGANPPNFTTAGNTFNIRNNANITLTGNWTVSGAGSGVTIGDGSTACNFTIPAAFALTGSVLNVYANATVTITNNTNLKPTLTSCTFDPASTLVYNNSASTTIQVPAGSNYGNLVIAGTGAGNTYTMNGALNIIGTLSLVTPRTLSLNNTGTNRIFTIGNYIQSAGTLDGGSLNTGDPNFSSYVNVTGNFNKTGGTLDNTSPSQYTCFQFTGNTAQNFSSSGTDNYMFVHVIGTTVLTLNSSMTLNGGSTQARTTFTVDAGATVVAGTNLIVNGSSGTSTNLINGTIKTAAPTGFSGGAATCITSANNPIITLGPLSTVEYNATVAQTVTTRADYANVIFSNNSTKTSIGGSTFSGDVSINTTATYAAGNFTQIIKGDFLNTGTFIAGAGTIHLNGSGTAQNIGPAGGSVTTFSTLRINNNAGVNLLQDANVATALTLSSGLLTTAAAGSGLLIMQNGSTAPALTDASTSYVNGPMQYQVIANITNVAINFPIGKSPDCRPLTLTVNHTNASQFNYLAESYNSPASFLGYSLPTGVDTVSGVHYWTIDRTDNSGVSQPSNGLNGNQTIKIYFGPNDFVYQGANLTIVKNTSGAPTTWFDIGGSCALGNFSTPQAGSVTSTSSPATFTSFSTFTLGSKAVGWNSLPIDLLNFCAAVNKTQVDLKWTTATEINNHFFTVDRSGDGSNFTKLTSINSKAPNGNSIAKLDYQTTDPDPLDGTSYYRLNQTDFNGAITYFKVVSVFFDKGRNIIFTVFPNPSSGQFMTDLSGVENNHEVLLLLEDEHGKQVYSNSCYSQELNNSTNIFPGEKLGKGVYFCSLIAEGVKYTVKTIVE